MPSLKNKTALVLPFKRKPRTHVDWFRAMLRFNNGETISAIARTVGVQPAVIGNGLARLGLRYKKPRLTYKLTKTEAAYLAGVIDGEGSIQIALRTRRKRDRSFDLRVSVPSATVELIDWIFSRLGGSKTVYKVPGKNHRPMWRWTMSAQKASDLLEQVLPYLVLKKPHAEIGIELRRRFMEQGLMRTEEEFNYRMGLKNRLALLNRRGIHAD